MSKQNMILIGGALALLWYVKAKQKTAAAAVTNATGPDAGVTYTTTQSAAAASAYYYPGSWQQ